MKEFLAVSLHEHYVTNGAPGKSVINPESVPVLSQDVVEVVETIQDFRLLPKLEAFGKLRSAESAEDIFDMYDKTIEPGIMESGESVYTIAVTGKHAVYKGTFQQGVSRLMKNSRRLSTWLAENNMELDVVEVQTSLFRDVAMVAGDVTAKPYDQFDDTDWDATSRVMSRSIKRRIAETTAYNQWVEEQNKQESGTKLKKRKTIIKIEGGYTNSIPVVRDNHFVSVQGQDRCNSPIYEMVLDEEHGENTLVFYNQASGEGTLNEYQYRTNTETIDDDVLLEELYKDGKKYYFTNIEGEEQDSSELPRDAQVAIARFLQKTRGSSSMMVKASQRHHEVLEREGIQEGPIVLFDASVRTDLIARQQQIEAFEKEDYQFARYWRSQFGKAAGRVRILTSEFSSDIDKWVNLDYFWGTSLAEEEMQRMGLTLVPKEVQSLLHAA